MKTCIHLEPLERALAEHGFDVDVRYPDFPGQPMDPSWYVCDCILDGPALVARLKLDPCVRWDDVVRGTYEEHRFTCTTCRKVIQGCNPTEVPKSTFRLA